MFFRKQNITFCTCLVTVLLLSGCQHTPSSDQAVTQHEESHPHPVEHASNDNADLNEASETFKKTFVQQTLVPTRILEEQATLESQDEASSLWERLRNSEPLPSRQGASVEAQIRRFKGDQVHFDRMIANAEPFMHYIIEALDQREMPLFLSLVPMIESAYDPGATSSWRAAGLWQFMPATGRHFGLEQNEWYDGRRDVDASTAAALDYLTYLHNRFKSWELALAAYNGGEATVARAIKRNRLADKPTDYWSLELPRETQAYIPRLLALQSIIYSPDAYAIDLPELADTAVLSQIDLPGQVQLSKLAELSDLDTQTLRQLNAGFLRSVTAPEGPHQLLVPVEVADQLSSRLASLPAEERIKYHEHIVKNGESLWRIARRYDTRVKTILSVNQLDSDRVKPGKRLLIPNTGQEIKHRPYAANSKKARQAARRGSVTSQRLYKVQEGDSLWLIARRHNIHVKDLLEWNALDRDTPLKLGQELKILNEKPILRAAASY